ncbi:MAG: alanine--tRNA ligase [Sandaracinaceae bacterium]
MSSSAIREAFLAFFEERAHARLPSGPLVPPNDPSLMFANAGMVQFKDVFTGKETRDVKRATTSQKCIRISGKHNDLENVGFTARHHTFFEMLGNFSFGDYFKAEAIEFAWAFMTEVLELPKDRLVVSVFGGEGSLPADDEAADLWHRIADLPQERILRCGAKDNFWSMGDTGPCGPCSEIHYFVGDGTPDLRRFGEEPTPAGEGWLELWNLVFMQYERQADGALDDLPAPSIDTGAGLERIAAVQQGVTSNYDTDLLRPIVDLAAQISGKAYGGTLTPDDVSMRVIADHARSAAFMISEGILPGNEKRRYVLRRVMRRAIRHGHRLGIHDLFFHRATLEAVALLEAVYPQLAERRALIEDVTQQEEARFRRTLSEGLARLEENDDWDEGEGASRVLPGRVAARLWTTYGFPVDLQEVIGQEQGFRVDLEGYEAAMAHERSLSAGDDGPGDQAVDDLYKATAQDLPPTDFVGHDEERGRGTVVALIADGASVETLAPGQAGEVVLDRTPLYAESGGQVGDRGELRRGEARFHVEDTQKPVDGLWVHRGRLEGGPLAVGDEVEAEVDHDLRTRTRRNHSATHLLHWALRTVLGPQAMQQGSLVAPDRLRFDYAGSRPMTLDEIRRVEDLVNGKVLLNAPVETEVLPIDEAKARGAIGIFEEKYGDVVRMLRMTDDSIELCGGTHAARTGDIGLFTIVSESGVAAGVRRIEAQTGQGAIAHVRSVADELGRAGALLKVGPQQAVDRVERLLAQQRELQREVEDLRKKLMSGSTRDLTAEAVEVDGARLLGTVVDLGDPKALRELADRLRDQLDPAVVLLGAATTQGKAILACSVSKDLVGRYHAGKIVKAAAEVVGGGGGGRPDFAQAGGQDPTRLADAVKTLLP